MSSVTKNVWLLSFLLKVVALLFSAALVHSDKIVGSLKSFKLSGNVTYDCVDIYKQPSLQHPLLKTHKIQMKPSVSRPKPKHQAKNKAYKKKINCPHGTVPILRNTEEYISKARRFEEMHINPLEDSPGNTYMVGVRASTGGPYHGIEGWFNVFDLNITEDQASYAFIYVSHLTNFIQVGWMINPGVFGDHRVRSYGFWRGKYSKGCYNVNCPGFVQVAKDVPIGYPYEPSSDLGWYHFSLHQDKQSGNWWLTKMIQNEPNVDIGYWPRALFDHIINGASKAGAAGAVQASHSGSSPPMGNGQRPDQNIEDSASFTNVGVLDSNYQPQRIDYTPIYGQLLGEKCYGLIYGEWSVDLGFNFNYGGPGGNSC